MGGEVAVVVGVGPGLGWALARTFADAGMAVVAVSRDPTKVKALAGGNEAARIRFEACDATRPEAVAQLFAGIERDLAAPDVVAFNAGAYIPGGILEIAPADFERCWRIGCFGGFVVGQAAARAMLPRGSGTILFTGATASLRGSARFANLAVPKSGLRALAQSMARELGPKGIHVAHVIIDGQIGASDDVPPARLSPEAIARAYLQLHRQTRDAWTLEMDLRPSVERF